MKKSSNKSIFQMDYTPCDLLVHDTQIDRAGVQGQSEQGLGRPQLMVLVDPFSRLITACWLSFEEKEETKSEH
jgi:hypothetical protein